MGKNVYYTEGQMISGIFFIKEINPAFIGKQKVRKGLFKCECGNEFIAIINNVKRYTTRSCGCVRLLSPHMFKPTHGMSYGKKRTPEYNIWAEKALTV